jgi:thiol-disulfide isomerase/thioredoxin
MIENYHFLFQYLKKEKIHIDQNEFTIQVQSHPDSPSLLAISDTLSFFKISNLATQIRKEDLIHLPDKFIALLKGSEALPFLAFIEAIENGFRYTQNEKSITITKESFLDLFQNIVLLAERDTEELQSSKIKKIPFQFIALGIIYLASLYITGFPLNLYSFVLLASIGMYLSVQAISQEFGIKTKFSEAVCSLSSNNSCDAVINGEKSKFIGLINFSVLSIVFFSNQLLVLLFLTISNQIISFYNISTILLLFSLPVTFTSIYQQFATKKWCPICLAIITVIYLELTTLLLSHSFSIAINTTSILFYLLALTACYLFIVFTKTTIKTNVELQSKIAEHNRFKRDYSLFKMALLASDTVTDNVVNSGSIILGNPEANLKIIVVSSPFCGHCKSVHKIIEDLLDRHRDQISIDFRFNLNYELSEKKSITVHQKLVNLYFEKGQDVFLKALHNWFEYKDIERLEITEETQSTHLKINEILHEQFLWNNDNEVKFTPTLIVNGYHFPKQYDRNDLIHFIKDLEEDDAF